MWAATYDNGGGSTHQCSFSSSYVQYPAKLWTETVNRLWRLRRQHWQQTSTLSPHHRHHPRQHTHTDHSHQQHEHLCLHPLSNPRIRPRSQHLYHPQSLSHGPHHSFPHPLSQNHQTHLRPPSHNPPHHDGTHLLQRHAIQQQGHQQPPPPSLPPSFVGDNDEGKSYESSKANGLQDANCAKSTQAATTLIQPDYKSHGAAQHQKRIKRLSSGRIEEILPVPSGLVHQTDSKALCHMVNNNVESYIQELKQPSSTTYKDYDFLRPPSIIQAGSLYHFKPPNLGQRDFEEWMRKHRRKKASKSACGSNIAFGRSIASQRRKSAAAATKTEAKNDTSFIKCMRGKLNARREVLKAIQDYHINAEARAQLEKRAREFEQEKKERMRKKVVSQKQAASDRRIRQSSVVNTLLK